MSRPPRILVSAGDTSGDVHGGHLVRELHRHRPDLEVSSLGGEGLRSAGARELVPLADNPVMGFGNVIGALGGFLRLLSQAERWLQRERPDLLLLIDYPGFNVNLASLAHRHGIPTAYYICPQYWGWAPWRVRRFARVVDHAFVIFPFEEAFLRDAGIHAQYVGHPVADQVLAKTSGRAADGERIAILPGSRRHEVRSHLDWLLQTAQGLQREAGRRLSLVTTHPRADQRTLMSDRAREMDLDLEVTERSLPELLGECRLALMGSGTATLEAAFLRVPALVLYRVRQWMLTGSRFLLTSPYISQPNLLAGQELFPEFLACASPVAGMTRSAIELWREGGPRTRCLVELDRLRDLHLKAGATRRVAAALLDVLDSPPARHGLASQV